MSQFWQPRFHSHRIRLTESVAPFVRRLGGWGSAAPTGFDRLARIDAAMPWQIITFSTGASLADRAFGQWHFETGQLLPRPPGPVTECRGYFSCPGGFW